MISVIVPAYNAAATLGACLRALDEQSVSRDQYEVIVVDDGSTDDTAALARSAGARVVQQAHQGPSAARNRGVQAAQGEIVLFVDADCEPGPEWIEQMTRPFLDPATVGAKGVYRTRQKSLLARLVQLEFEIRYERMARLPQIDFVDTYSAAYRRAVFNEHGGFDCAYPVPSAEDIDLSFRIARAGHRLVFAPAGWVWHTHPTSLRYYLARKARYAYWRALLYLRYPDKIGGDAHTDPALKAQFLLLAMAGWLTLGSLFLPALGWAAAACGIALLMTTLPFVCWAWRRDRMVALFWPWVSVLRVLVQGCALGGGLVVHSIRRSDKVRG